jgi:hypothetical protein
MIIEATDRGPQTQARATSMVIARRTNIKQGRAVSTEKEAALRGGATNLTFVDYGNYTKGSKLQNLHQWGVFAPAGAVETERASR